ncbi:restriction endonuclease subunit S [Mycoplasma anserisalpingitidis]|uniref:restriction endonuclease subunit S n=1 Tax=Mycoplasma anserisalpingitidis TaxID=519450 RepID=UPI001CF71516|nr:restriction endonuclease subunit S [Mycoplasma anserisalpingitidis]UCU27409.1 restriction endonuclease subunit S [Mycoplasma anserisalpingitidis]
MIIQIAQRERERERERCAWQISREYFPIFEEAEKFEWKSLSEIGKLYTGLKSKNKYDFTNGNFKYVSYINIFNNDELNEDFLDNWVYIDKDENQNNIKYGDILFTGSSENLEEAGLSSVVNFFPREKIYLNSFSFGLRLNEPKVLIPKFSKYLFRSELIRKQIINITTGVTRFNVSKEKISKIKIPIPPIETQNKIVKILDKFSVLTEGAKNSLPKEIKLRKQQYEYYRNKLLDFPKE